MPVNSCAFTTIVGDIVAAYALPFLELMRSDVSRLRARLGSKFCGSTAFSGRESTFELWAFSMVVRIRM